MSAAMKLATKALSVVLGFMLVVSAAQAKMQDLPFAEYLKRQEEISARRMLANISARDTHPGSVIASPSRHDPDYFFHWVRDAGLVMDPVVIMYRTARGAEKQKLGKILRDYVDFSRKIQQTKTLTGLGEPKYHVDGSAFNGPWGRPQNDSPALRALSLTRWAKQLLREGKRDYVVSKLYSGQIPANTVIKADLEYVSHHWRERGFDLWEEISGNHFYTRAVQRAALEEGADLARALGDGGAAKWYLDQARAILNSMDDHWDARRGRIVQTLNRNDGADYKNSGLDSATVLAVIHGGWETGPFSVIDERVLATAAQLETAFHQEYAINQRGLPATAVGRYPEDRYYGGNPWVLTIAAFAELNYRLATVLQKRPPASLSPRQVAYLRSAFRSQPGLVAMFPKSGRMPLARGSQAHAAIVKGLIERGDDFIRRIQVHGHTDGGLAEQIRRDNGFMESARDLTWSYSSFLTAIWSRPGAQPASFLRR